MKVKLILPQNTSFLKYTLLLLFVHPFILYSCDKEEEQEKKLIATVSANEAMAGVDALTFTDQSLGVASRTWTFPGGEPATSDEPEVSVVFSEVGDIVATLRVVYYDGTEETKEFPITITTIPLDEETKITKVKLLAIGNSFSEDALEYYLHGLSHANGDTIIIGNLYIGGASLETHYKNSVNNAPLYSYRKIVNGEKIIIPDYTILDAIKEERWDYISFQQVSSLSGIYESFFPYLTSLISYVKEHSINPDVEFVLHSTWAYAQNSTHEGFVKYGNDQMKMYNAIIDTYQNVAEEIGVDIIIPAGTAIQNGRTSTLGDTFCRDGYHLEQNYGRYTASCAWYEKIFKKTVVGNSYIPNNISKFQADVAQSAAHHAVVNPYQVTSLAHLVDDTPIEPFTKMININFGGNDVPKWNALYNEAKIDKLKDINNAYTNISVEITERFGGVNASGPTTTNTEMNMPSEVSSYSLFGNVEPFSSQVSPKATILFSSMDPVQPYDFKIFASRMGVKDNRETYYTFSGIEKGDTTIYLNASNNTTNIVKALNIRANKEGIIEIEVGPGDNNNNPTGFYYITALSIEPSIPIKNE